MKCTRIARLTVSTLVMVVPQGIYVEQILCYNTAIYVKILEILLFSSKAKKEMVSSIGCVDIYMHLAKYGLAKLC